MNRFNLFMLLVAIVLSSNCIQAQCPGTPPLAFTFESTESRCESNGTITLHIEGGTPFTDAGGNPIYNNAIIAPINTPVGGQSDSVFAALAADTYTVEVLDANGCSVTQQVTVPGTHMQLELEIDFADAICDGSGGGWICGTPAEGRPFPPGYYEYQLFDASTNPPTPITPVGLDSCFTNLAAGTYQIKAFDSCSNFQTRDVIIGVKPQAQTFGFNAGRTDISCNKRCWSFRIRQLPGDNPPEYPVDWEVTASDDPALLGKTGILLSGNNSDSICWAPAYKPGAMNIVFTDQCGVTYSRQLSFGEFDYNANLQFSCSSGFSASFNRPIFCTSSSMNYEMIEAPAGVPISPPQTSGVFDSLQQGTYRWEVTDCCGNVSTERAFVSGYNFTYRAFMPSQYTCINGEVGFRNTTSGSSPVGDEIYILTSAPQGYTSMLPDTMEYFELIKGPAGTYCITIVDECLITSDTCILMNNPLLFDYESTVTLSCVTGNSIQANLNQTGGINLNPTADFFQIAPVMTTIQSNLNNFIWNNLTAGTYVVVMENSSCDLVADTIVIPDYIQPSISGTWGIECDNGVGLITVEGTDGNTPYTYELFQGPVTRPLQSSPTFPGLPIGTYDIRMFDNCGNSEITTQSIEPFMPVIQGYGGASCLGDTLVLFVDYFNLATYSWTGPNTATSDTSLLVLSNLTAADAGTYTVNVDVKNPDQSACVAQTLTLDVAVFDCNCEIDTIIGTDLSCFGGSDGMAAVTTTNGVPPYTFLWSNGAVTQDISDLTTGLYKVTITDANSCSVTGEVTLTAPDSLTVSVMETNTSCNGASDGSITATTAGGTPSSGGCISVTYLWSNNATTATINNLAVGMYTVTTTDCNGCTATAEAAISEPSLIVIAASSTDASCANGEDGSITLIVNGGTIGIPNCSDYTYLWDNGAMTSTISNLAAGMYTVTVTDCNGCSMTAAAAISEPSPIAINATTSNVSCASGADGSIALSVSGGTIGTATCMDYTYLWSNNATTATITGLVAGSYNFTVTDCNGCSQAGLLVISEPAAITCAITGTNTSCNAGSDGSAVITATGGTAPYTFSWDNNSTSSMISGLVAGTYSATVTDNLGCTTTCDVQIMEPTPLSIATATTDITCFGDMDGAIDITASGGTTACGGPSDLFISEYIEGSGNNKCIEIYNGTGAAIDLSTYSLAVYANGNSNPTGTYNFQAVMLADNDVFVICNGSATTVFTAAADVLSGVMNYNGDDAVVLRNNGSAVDIFGNIGCDPGSLWSAGGIATQNRTLVRNATVSGGITMDDPTACPFSTLATEWTELPEDDASNIGMHTFAGGAGYSFEWNTGATTEDLTGLSAGTYVVTVTDCNGCTATESVMLAEPALLTITDSIQQVSCNNGEDGSIMLTATGGTIGIPNCSDYTYEWSNGATAANNTGLTVGTYAVTVTDCNGCTITSSYDINEPLTLSCSIVASEIACAGESDGTATVTATGGTAPYMYLWSSGETTPAITGLSTGAYNITVTDSLGCVTDCSIIIEEPSLFSVILEGADLNCNGDMSGIITATATGGTQIGTGCTGVTYLWSNGAMTATISGLTGGTYTVTATDCNGCSDTASITLIEPSLLTIIDSIEQVTCFDGEDGSITLTVSGGVNSDPDCLGYDFVWSNGATTQNLTGLTADTYTVTVIDCNGCIATDSYLINEPLELSCSIVASEIACAGETDGTATVSATGGTAPYLYLWTTGETTLTITGLTSGNYDVTVTDALGCNTQCSISIQAPDLFSVSLANVDVDCNGEMTGSITATTTGGATMSSGCPGVTYLWSNGEMTPSITGLPAGVYIVTATDCNRCTAIDSITIVENPLLSCSIVGTDVLCNGGGDGTAIVTATGGTNSYTYLWSNGSAVDTVYNLITGDYFVTVTDKTGCTTTCMVTINEPQKLSSTVSVMNVSCSSTSDGQAIVMAAGGMPGYTYLWDTAAGGQTTPMVTGLMAGTYQVSVTDANGCCYVAAVAVGQDVCDPCELVTNGVLDICVTLTADPNHPLASLDCDNGGVINIIECNQGTDPTAPSDDCEAAQAGAIDICALLADNADHPLASLDCDNGGVINIIECDNGTNPFAPSDDCQAVKNGGLDLCIIIGLNPNHPLSTQDCDNGGVDNYTECRNSGDPCDPNDDCRAAVLADINICTILDPEGDGTFDATHPWASLDCDQGGIINITECINGADPGMPSDDIVYTPDLCDEAVLGNIDICTLLTNDPDDPIGTLDCDGDGVMNSTECVADTTDPLDPCYFVAGSITLPVTADQSDCLNLCPDLTPIVTILPGNIAGASQVGVAIEITELNDIDTDGTTITIRVPSDPRLLFIWDPSLTSVALTPVNNSNWNYLGDNGFVHTFTYNGTGQVIVGGTTEAFGMQTTYDPQNTDGQTTLTATIVPFGGGECNIINNTDSERLVYFQ